MNQEVKIKVDTAMSAIHIGLGNSFQAADDDLVGVSVVDCVSVAGWLCTLSTASLLRESRTTGKAQRLAALKCSGLGTKLLANQELVRPTPVDAIAEITGKMAWYASSCFNATLIAIQNQLTDLIRANDTKNRDKIDQMMEGGGMLILSTLTDQSWTDLQYDMNSLLWGSMLPEVWQESEEPMHPLSCELKWLFSGRMELTQYRRLGPEH